MTYTNHHILLSL